MAAAGMRFTVMRSMTAMRIFMAAIAERGRMLAAIAGRGDLLEAGNEVSREVEIAAERWEFEVELGQEATRGRDRAPSTDIAGAAIRVDSRRGEGRA